MVLRYFYSYTSCVWNLSVFYSYSHCVLIKELNSDYDEVLTLVISSVELLVASIVTSVVSLAVSVNVSPYGLVTPVPSVIVYAVDALSILSVYCNPSITSPHASVKSSKGVNDVFMLLIVTAEELDSDANSYLEYNMSHTTFHPLQTYTLSSQLVVSFHNSHCVGVAGAVAHETRKLHEISLSLLASIVIFSHAVYVVSIALIVTPSAHIIMFCPCTRVSCLSASCAST